MVEIYNNSLLNEMIRGRNVQLFSINTKYQIDCHQDQVIPHNFLLPFLQLSLFRFTIVVCNLMVQNAEKSAIKIKTQMVV